MIVCQRVVCLSVLAFFTVGCAQPWPDNLSKRTYTGVVFNGSLNVPASGAEINAYRPTFKHRGLVFGLYADEYPIGHAVADAAGHFTLQTETGYATFLAAHTSDGHLTGTQTVEPEETNGLRITAEYPTFGPIEYDGEVNPELKVFRVTQPAVQQIIHYVAAHPHEPLRSLEDYAGRRVISQEALAAFIQNNGYFFGPSPRVKFGWGKDVIVFSDARKPISLRHGKLGYDPVM